MIRTRDLLITNQLHYLLCYTSLYRAMASPELANYIIAETEGKIKHFLSVLREWPPKSREWSHSAVPSRQT